MKSFAFLILLFLPVLPAFSQEQGTAPGFVGTWTHSQARGTATVTTTITLTDTGFEMLFVTSGSATVQKAKGTLVYNDTTMTTTIAYVDGGTGQGYVAYPGANATSTVQWKVVGNTLEFDPDGMALIYERQL